MSDFITPFLSAIILYVILRKPMEYFTQKLKMKQVVAALILMVVSFVVVLLPLTLMIWMLTTKVNYVLNHSDEIISGLMRVDNFLEQYIGFKILSAETLNRARALAAQIVPGFLSKTADAGLALVIMYFILFFMLTNAGVVESKMEEYLPFRRENNRMFISEMENMVMANAMGAPLLALVQGIFAWIGYLIFGVPEPLFWAVMTALFSFVPMVGTPLVWLPAGLFQITAGYLWLGVGILIYGVIIISNVDNVFRFIFQKKFADIHPLTTLLGVLMGIQILGLPGIVFGPLFISWFLLMVKIYKQEFYPKSVPDTSDSDIISENEKSNSG